MPTLAADRSAWLDLGWVRDNADLIASSLREHLLLTGWALAGGLAISVPLALLARRWRWLYPPTLWLAGVLYTVPSLAAYAVLIPYFGLGRATALIPLITYTLLILVRGVVDGLDGVPTHLRDAAAALGYSASARLWRIEVPLALPSLVAALRLAAVTVVGLVTVAGLVGFDNLGQFMLLRGFRDGRRTPIVVGMLLIVAVAAAIDVTLVALERLAMPWRRRTRCQRVPAGGLSVLGARPAAQGREP
jgi:osmoprotectant transport system permease protein